MKKLLLVAGLLFLKQWLYAQPIPVIIQGGTIHVGNGTVIQDGYLVLMQGKVVLCGKELTTQYKNARVINAAGKHIYPGIICMNSYVGLNEIDAIRATRDFQEAGEINPNARALIAYNTDSKIIPTVRFNGVTYTQVVPQGGLVSGLSSVMKTEGWNWEDAMAKADDGIHINWPEHDFYGGWVADFGEAQRKRMEKNMEELNSLFEEAYRYYTLAKPDKINLRMEAMKGLFNGSKNAYAHVNSARGILSVIQFMKKYPSVKLVLVGANDAWKVADIIKENNIPVVLYQLHRLPQRSSEDIDQPFKTPALLLRKGIRVAIGHGGSWEARNIMFNAGTAAAYGLSKEEALMCITKYPAEVLGMSASIGTLEAGKNATVVISSGDILDMRTNQIEWMFIDGEEINNKNHQYELYEKYIKKYGIKQ